MAQLASPDFALSNELAELGLREKQKLIIHGIDLVWLRLTAIGAGNISCEEPVAISSNDASECCGPQRFLAFLFMKL
jgi:hypothetical protein